MSQSAGIFNTGSGSESGFETALWGYEKKQVNKYIAQIEAELAAGGAEREEGYNQIRVLTQQIAQLQHEVLAARNFVAAGESVSFRHLGPRVEQILALAEEQAAAIRTGVMQDMSGQKHVAGEIILRAQEDAAQV